MTNSFKDGATAKDYSKATCSDGECFFVVKEGLSGGAIAGIIIGSIALVVMVLAALFCFCKK